MATSKAIVINQAEAEAALELIEYALALAFPCSCPRCNKLRRIRSKLQKSGLVLNTRS